MRQRKNPSKTPIYPCLDSFYSGPLFALPASCARRRCRTFRASFSSPSSTLTYVVGSSRRSCPSTIQTLYRGASVSAALSSNRGHGCAFALQYSAPVPSATFDKLGTKSTNAPINSSLHEYVEVVGSGTGTGVGVLLCKCCTDELQLPRDEGAGGAGGDGGA